MSHFFYVVNIGLTCTFSYGVNKMKNFSFDILLGFGALLCSSLGSVKAVLPGDIPDVSYLPALSPLNNGENRNRLIEQYFSLGLNYCEILGFLLVGHGIQLSLRQLKRILKSLNLRRRNTNAGPDIDETIAAIENELRGSGCCLGYRQMHQRLVTEYGLTVDRETVRIIVKELDPQGVALRCQKRLRRRLYVNQGPNYLWHLDGYDKLKPFGFCIHGAIDGYSRRILWLEVASTNNNPRVVAKFYLSCLKELGGSPRCIRGDCGTENIYIAGMQRFLRRNGTDSFAGVKSFVYGRSVSNQRIESWWSQMRKTSSGWWINFFKDMRDTGIYNDDDPVHCECLMFCFMPVIKQELYTVARNWNLHRIRASRHAESPPGKPDVLFFLSENNVSSYLSPVDEEDLDAAQELCTTETSYFGCSDEFVELATMIMEESYLDYPKDAHEAKTLYIELLNNINNL